MKLGQLPKVLIAAPVSQRHQHLFKRWIRHLNGWNYPNFEVLLVDTTPDTKDYFKEIGGTKVKGKQIHSIRHEWNSHEQHPMHMLADVREKIRQEFLKGNYNYLFFLDDDIFIPKNGLLKLLSYDKDHIGFYVHIFHGEDKKPCIFKSGEIITGKGIDLFDWSEINQYKRLVKKHRVGSLGRRDSDIVRFMFQDMQRPNLLKAYAVNLGCLLIRKNVLEQCDFSYPPEPILGEDIWYFSQANDRKFEFWVDTDIRAKHLNTEWNTVLSRTRQKMQNIFIAHGPADAQGVDVVDRSFG